MGTKIKKTDDMTEIILQNTQKPRKQFFLHKLLHKKQKNGRKCIL